MHSLSQYIAWIPTKSKRQGRYPHTKIIKKSYISHGLKDCSMDFHEVISYVKSFTTVEKGKGQFDVFFILHNTSKMACGQFFTGKEFSLGHTLMYKRGMFPKKRNATN